VGDVTIGWVATDRPWDLVHVGDVVVWDEAAGVLAMVVERDAHRMAFVGMDVPGGYRWGIERTSAGQVVPVLVRRDVLVGQIIERNRS
jgi:hypothetical protein